MKFFFAAYCFGGQRAQTLIGVYKRCLRIGLKAAAAGHQVFVHCTGRQFYHDDFTRKAERELEFVEIESKKEGAHYRRAAERKLAELAPDLVILGEAPLSGNFLAIYHAAVARRLPIVILDNAYSPPLVRNFLRDHGSICDGLILTGLSSCYTPNPPAHLRQVPPFFGAKAVSPRSFLSSLGLKSQRLLTILGYDDKAASLGLSVAEHATDQIDGCVLIARNPELWLESYQKLPDKLRSKTRVIAPPKEEILFGLMALSRLVVAKYGFMQLTECLGLGTPILLAYHDGARWLNLLPATCRDFVLAVDEDHLSDKNLEKALSFLAGEKPDLDCLHQQDEDAAEASVEFLTQVRRRVTLPELSRKGFTPEILTSALRRHFGDVPIALDEARCTLIHRSPLLSTSYSIVCHARVGCFPEVIYLRGRRYANLQDAERDHGEARSSKERTVLHYSAPYRVLVELDHWATDLSHSLS